MSNVVGDRQNMSRCDPFDISATFIEVIDNKKKADKVIEIIVLDDDGDDNCTSDKSENQHNFNVNFINTKFRCSVDLHNSTDINEISSCLKCQKFINSDLMSAKRKERRRKPKVPHFINCDSRNSEDFYFKANKKKDDNLKSAQYKFTCRVCGKIFLLKCSLKVHLYLHISNDVNEGL